MASVNAEEVNTSLVVLGDSRCCGLIVTLLNDPEAVCYYENLEDSRYDAIFEKNGRRIVICSEGGGYYRSGAYDRAINRASKLLTSNPDINNMERYSVVCMFGFNDLLLDGANSYYVAPKTYLQKDAALRDKIKRCGNIYQFNAGPVNEEGSVRMCGGPDNALVADYNIGFSSTPRVTVIDLYSYLMNEGFGTLNNENDDSGIHYDEKTNVKIINLLMGIK